MSLNTAQFPAAVWDGSSPHRTPADNSIDRSPDFEDWDQIVAELIATQTKSLAGGQDITVPNGVGGAVVVGAPVYMLANASGAQKADCNGTAPARNVCGLVTTGQSGSGGNVVVRQRGQVTLTTAQWDAVTGDTGGLTPFVEYYLSATAGQLAKTVPATTGDNVVVVGIAESTTVLNLNIRHSRISA